METFNRIYSYFFPIEDVEAKLKQAYDVLNKQDEVKPEIIQDVDNGSEDFVFTTHSGYITNVDLETKMGTIDKKYKFKMNSNLEIDAKVSFDVYKVAGELVVSNVQRIYDEWDDKSNKSGKWFYKTVIVEVTQRNGRVLTGAPGDLQINLDKIQSDFIPHIGDWLQLDVISEIDENVPNLNGKIIDILKIAPQYLRVVNGTVTKWDGASGIINGEIYFDKTAVESFIPVKGDRLVAEVMESKQKQFKYRALKVVIDTYQGSIGRERYQNDALHRMKNINDKSSNQTFRGERNKTTRFITKSICQFNVPKSMWQIFLESGDDDILPKLLEMYPVLNDNFNIRTYERTLNYLLYFEEISVSLQMRNYDQNCACFVRNGEYLLWEVENLAERRPSIVIGDKVIVTDSEKQLNYEGFVYKCTNKHVYIKFGSFFQDTYKGEDYAVHVQQSRFSMRKLHHAIQQAVVHLGTDILFPSKLKLNTPQLEFSYDQYFNNEKRLSHKEIVKLLSPKGPKHNKAELKLEWYNTKLNYYQKEAVRNILLGEARPLPYVIFGPPGTGKTITVIEIILQITRMMPEARILVGTPSNSAADLIALRLIDSNCLQPGDLIRLVSFISLENNSIPINLIPYCATASFAREGTGNKSVVRDDGAIIDCPKSVLGKHRITIGTCSTLGSLLCMGFTTGHFTHIIIDEAGQCSEPESMLPLVFLDNVDGQAILAGDPKQLGPVVMSRYAQYFGLEESYLERIMQRFPYVRDDVGFPNSNGYDPRLVTKLVYNYRSLPGVITISNQLFYNMDMRPTISEEDSKEAEFLMNLKEMLPECKEGLPSMVFHGINGENMRSEDSPSWYNPDEASQILFYVSELYRLGVKSDEIGIISPYVKQVKHIRMLLTEASFDVPKIGTVEEFQGQEFKTILISTVRSSSEFVRKDLLHSLGFISNPKRFNVALTRAQCLCIIVGNPHLLREDVNWRTLIRDCWEGSRYVGCEICFN